MILIMIGVSFRADGKLPTPQEQHQHRGQAARPSLSSTCGTSAQSSGDNAGCFLESLSHVSRERERERGGGGEV